MKKIVILFFILISLIVIGFASAEEITLFEATHYGHDQGNWNVGLWRYFGNGEQIPYRTTTDCGSFYAGGPVNHAAQSRALWQNGYDTHHFILTYDPITRQLSLNVNGIEESAETPQITEQLYCDESYTLYSGGEIGKVNKLKIRISASAGTSVPSCEVNCENRQVGYSKTEISNLMLNGIPVEIPVVGEYVEASLSDNPTATSFTNEKFIEVEVPSDSPWTLTGDEHVQADDGQTGYGADSYVPKKDMIGMIVYGVYEERKKSCYLCSGENFADEFDVVVGKDTIRLKKIGNYYYGYKKKLSGSIYVTLNYLQAPKSSNIFVVIDGSLFSPTNYYFYSDSKCHINGEIEAVEVKSPTNYSLVGGGEKINVIIGKFCIERCKTDEDCWRISQNISVEEKPVPEECNFCDISKKVCTLKKNQDGCKICNGLFKKPIFLPIGAYCSYGESGGNCVASDSAGETKCEKSSCESNYGEQFTKCAGKNLDEEDRCCGSNQNCCFLNENSDAVCCDKEDYNCKGFSLLGNNANLCNVNKCPPELNRPVFCDGGKEELKNAFGINWCCREGEKCAVQTVLLDIRAPVCAEDTCVKGETLCRDEGVIGGKLCCREGETCTNIAPSGKLKICMPETCKVSEHLCVGIREVDGKISFCCKSGEICTHSPNGFPKCNPLPKKIPVVDPVLTGEVVLSFFSEEEMTLITNKSGFYALKNRFNLTETGEMFYIYSNNFSEEIEFKINNSENLDMYFYEEESLLDCIVNQSFFENISTSSAVVSIDLVSIKCNDYDEKFLGTLFELEDSLRRVTINSIFGFWNYLF
ncbi:MAG: hypothetical protein KKB21_05270 [Nanoarchaeota archaeon]|nr:hypothetical protein [Nanoarchaeota archaeon]